MEKLLTICVCAYNMEKLLPRALESCLIPDCAQIEVLIMNDGSTDRTGDIADEYARRYPETVLHIRKENGGWGSNLNQAVKIARGKYFKELDADDWYIKENLQKLLQTLQQTEADMVITDHVYCYPDREKANNPEWKQYATQERSMSNTTPFYFPVWDAAFKTEVLKANYRDLPEHTQYTDNLFILYILPHIKTVRFENSVLYCYMLGREGQSVGIESLRKHFDELIKVQRMTFDFYENCNFKHNQHVLYKVKTTYYIFLTYFLRMYKNSDINIAKVIKENDLYVRRRIPELYRSSREHKKLFLLRATNYHLVFFFFFCERGKEKKL